MTTLVRWEVDDTTFWEAAGKRIAYRNLWTSIPNLLCGFAVWMLWSTIIVRIQTLNDANPDLFAFTGPDGQPLRGNDYRRSCTCCRPRRDWRVRRCGSPIRSWWRFRAAGTSRR